MSRSRFTGVMSSHFGITFKISSYCFGERLLAETRCCLPVQAVAEVLAAVAALMKFFAEVRAMALWRTKMVTRGIIQALRVVAGPNNF